MRSLIAQAGVAIDLLPGCELSATSDIDALGRAGDLVPLGGKGRFLLVELPFTGHVGAMQNLFFELEVMGYRIIIAHPERSMACQREPDLIERLHDRGYWTQINAGSFAGRNGRRVRNLCLQWLRKGLVDVIASDGHSVRSRRPLLSPARKTVIKATDENTWDELTVHNPAQVLASESKGTD
jgi:protein-tyrosine phosphatase